MLKLKGSMTVTSCPNCGGRGKVPARDQIGRTGKLVPGAGMAPCPVCKGKKTVTYAGKDVVQ